MTPAAIVTVSGPRRPRTGEMIARKSSRKSILMDVQSWQKLETVCGNGESSNDI
jgi:hypothetical protein